MLTVFISVQALSISQLAIFSPEQAEAVTEAQRNVLAWDKYNALMGAQYGENADPYTVTPPPEPTAEMTTSGNLLTDLKNKMQI